ncbi:hypothetical protein BU14_2332s0001 [Porphyra umbilicalis]|uniref:Uncharacterized protein n=1 Tax=Porphyra umbilicalis TaxID=2786 RepID=A0A1X6NK38_PORUM|nr:hypothetical protein BU14_2332s0001 [Porphyra umbilicalis]|eukprot:OSX68723.1 hypothetical protein BU14_2332s0001 [Porphyra umbilicalis]
MKEGRKNERARGLKSARGETRPRRAPWAVGVSCGHGAGDDG